MPRITNRGSRIDPRRATTVGLTSLATLTLAPLLTHAKPSERTLLLLAALPAAALFGYLAGYAAGSATHLEVAALQTAQVSGLQLRAAQLQAAQPSAPVIRLISKVVPRPGTGSPVGSGHLAALARPPAERPAGQPVSQHRDGLSERRPHLTLIVTQHPTS